MIEADLLGRLRTGAASAVAARRLARPGARTLGVIGCGRQAEAQVACLREALPAIDEVVAYCRDGGGWPSSAGGSVARRRRATARPARQDVVVTATTSRDPVLRGEWLRPGALVCAIGANEPSARELDNAVVERASFVCCDSLETARREAGDLIEPVERGVLDWLEVHELQDVVAGELPGRETDDDIVLFKSNGIAAWDVAVGAAAVELARERGLGRDSRRRLAQRRGGVGADGVDHVGPLEQAPALLLGRAGCGRTGPRGSREAAAAAVLADHVGGEPVLRSRPREQERERIAEEREVFQRHAPDCILGP